MTKLNPYIIDGVEIERVQSYALVVFFKHGAVKIIANGHNPQEVRSAEIKVARNPAVIQRIEFRDLSGPLETIWDADWKECPLCYERDGNHHSACAEVWSHVDLM